MVGYNFKIIFTAEPQRAQRILIFHLPLRGRQMKIRNHVLVYLALHSPAISVKRSIKYDLSRGNVVFHFLASH
jgi:hypothetical protein